MLGLRRKGFDMPFVRGGELRAARPCLDAARAAIEAGVIDRDVIDHRAVVNVGDIGVAHIGHGAVVVELAVAPFTADEAHAAVAEAVIHAAIEADGRPPVTDVPDVGAIDPAPVAGRPQEPDGRQYPGARHPVIAFVPRPVAWRPDVARPWDGW